MATPTAIPLQIISGLRCVQYKFSMPSAGVAPNEKYLMYRLKNVTDNTYLTNWKFYRPVVDGQIIPIDFTKDLQGILQTTAPNLSLNTIGTNTTILKTITVEYGERNVNTDTCEVTDVEQGTTNPIDVLNGIKRHEGLGSLTGVVLHQRAKRYSVSAGSVDHLYVVGNMNVLISYYDASNVFISSVSHSINQPFPNSICTIIPIGFSIAPAGTNLIHISTNATGAPSIANDLLFSIDCNFYPNESGALYDLYFQNNLGGNDLLSFESLDQMAMNVNKQEIVNKYDCGSTTNNTTGQRQVINNDSYPILTFKRTFNNPLSFNDQKWLNEIAATNNVWVKEIRPNGFPVLLKLQLTNSEILTRGATHEFVISGYYSEVFLFPY